VVSTLSVAGISCMEMFCKENFECFNFNVGETESTALWRARNLVRLSVIPGCSSRCFSVPRTTALDTVYG
jgi:hypothetical protein